MVKMGILDPDEGGAHGVAERGVDCGVDDHHGSDGCGEAEEGQRPGDAAGRHGRDGRHDVGRPRLVELDRKAPPCAGLSLMGHIGPIILHDTQEPCTTRKVVVLQVSLVLDRSVVEQIPTHI